MTSLSRMIASCLPCELRRDVAEDAASILRQVEADLPAAHGRRARLEHGRGLLDHVAGDQHLAHVVLRAVLSDEPDVLVRELVRIEVGAVRCVGRRVRVARERLGREGSGRPAGGPASTSRSSRRAVVPMRSSRRDWPVSWSFRCASSCVRKHPRLTSAELSTQYWVSYEVTVMASIAACAASWRVEAAGQVGRTGARQAVLGLVDDRDAVLGRVGLGLRCRSTRSWRRPAGRHAPLARGSRRPGGAGRARRARGLLRDGEAGDGRLRVLRWTRSTRCPPSACRSTRQTAPASTRSCRPTLLWAAVLSASHP